MTLGDRWIAARARIVSTPTWVLACACGAWIAVTHGVAQTPNIEIWQRAARAFPHPAGHDFIQSSPLGMALAHALHADRSTGAYAALHLALVVAAVAIMAAVVRRRFGDTAAKLTIAAAFASPLANVLLTWLGQPDPITLATGAVVAVATGPAALATAAAIGTFGHAEQSVFLVVAVLVARGGTGDLRRRQAVATVAGVAAGFVALTVFKAHYDIHAESRLAFADSVGPRRFFDDFGANWLVVIVASMGAAWVLFVGLVANVPRRQMQVFVAIVTELLVVSIFTFDTTRVFALTSIPVVIVLIGYASTTLQQELLDQMVAVTIVAGALYPHLVVWEGSVYITSLRRTAHWLF